MLRYSQFYCTTQIDHIKTIKIKKYQTAWQTRFHGTLIPAIFIYTFYIHIVEIRLKRMHVCEYRLLRVHSPINRIVQTREHIDTATRFDAENIPLTYFFQFKNIVNGYKLLIILEIIMIYWLFYLIYYIWNFFVTQVFMKEKRKKGRIWVLIKRYIYNSTRKLILTFFFSSSSMRRETMKEISNNFYVSFHYILLIL